MENIDGVDYVYQLNSKSPDVRTSWLNCKVQSHGKQDFYGAKMDVTQYHCYEGDVSIGMSPNAVSSSRYEVIVSTMGAVLLACFALWLVWTWILRERDRYSSKIQASLELSGKVVHFVKARSDMTTEQLAYAIWQKIYNVPVSADVSNLIHDHASLLKGLQPSIVDVVSNVPAHTQIAKSAQTIKQYNPWMSDEQCWLDAEKLLKEKSKA